MNTTAPLSFTDSPESRQLLQHALQERYAHLAQLLPYSPALERALLQYEIADILLELDEHGMRDNAWGLARSAFTIYLEHQQWEQAVRCCDILYRCDLPASVPALGNGLWLAVTYPIDPELSIVMLNQLIEATPDKADGAAVAAAVAHYIADLRLEGDKRDSVMFLTSAMLGKVAERHSQINSQAAMNLWLQRMGLLDPAVFLPRFRQVLEAIVEGQWWYDREVLRARLPVN